MADSVHTSSSSASTIGLLQLPLAGTSASGSAARRGGLFQPQVALPDAKAKLPIVPDVLLTGIGDLPDTKDPLGFMESCPVRGVGAAAAGAAMGLLFGAFFSSYGALAPYDPSHQQWQQSMSHLQQKPAATAHVPLETLVKQGTSGSSLAAAARSAPATAIAAVESAASASAAAVVSAGAAATQAATAATTAVSTAVTSAVPHAFPERPVVPMATAFKEGMIELKAKSLSSAKNFGIVGAVYTTFECTLEKVRGRKDMKNAVTAGFATGAVLAARAGPSAMLMGGAGFAAFSAVIELVSPMLFDH